MKRDLQALASQDFDIVVVGGGIAGVSVAREAALRGLSVALVERDDFASGSTGRTLGMIHGAIRSLQRLDLGRLRALSVERNALLNTAPHLVQPVPVAVPTYGHGRDGKSALHVGLGLYDFLTSHRNEGIADPSRRLAGSRTIGRAAALELFPGLPQEGLTGAAIFTDAQMYHPVRFALAVLRAAVDAGALVANGLEATGVVRRGIAVTGVGVRCRESGEAFVIRGRVVVNTAGAWAGRILEEGLGVSLDPPIAFSRRISLVVDRRPTHRMGLALLDENRASLTPLSRSKHHLFVMPWRDRLVLGDWHRHHGGATEDADVSAEEVEACVGEINERYPGLRLHPDEVVWPSVALVLLEGSRGRTRPVRDAAQARLVDHAAFHGTRGIISLVGATWGTARLEAIRVVDEVLRRSGSSTPPSGTSTRPVHGGDLESLEDVVQEAHAAALEWGFSRGQAQDMVRAHGTGYGDVFDLLREDPDLARFLPGTRVLRADVVHAVRAEMALTLDDVVRRRTDLGLEVRSRSALEEAAYLMGRELGWSPDRKQREVARALALSPTAPAPVPEHAQG